MQVFVAWTGRGCRKMAGSRAMLAAAMAAAMLAQGEGFYLPGVAPRKYVPGEQLMVKVNTLTSDLTPLQVSASLKGSPLILLL